MARCLLVWLLYWVLSSWSVIQAGATTPIVLQDETGMYRIGNHVVLLEDTSASLTLPQVLAMAAFFQPSQQSIPNFGPTASAVWCRFRLENKTSQQWYLEVDFPIDSIDLYASTADGYFEHTQLGTRYPFAQRPVLTNQFIIPLEVAPGATRTYYLRVSTSSTLQIPLTVASIQQFYEYHHRQDVFNGVYFGLVLALILYNLFVFITIRDVTYLYYVLYILNLALTIGYLLGYTFEFLTPQWPWFAHMGLTSLLMYVSVVLFSDSFLLAKYYAPRIRVVGALVLLLTVTDFILTLTIGRLAGFKTVILSISLLMVYVFVLGFTVYRRGFKPARFYLLGFGILAISGFIVVLRDFNILPAWLWTKNLPQIASGLEITVLSFALADKLNTYKREKEQAQEQALKQATQFSQQLIQSQEHERKRIAAELHDSIGQSLILIKNKMLMLKNKMFTPEKASQQIEHVTTLLGNTIGEVRSISYGLRPFQLDMLGLSQSVQSLAEEVATASGITFTVEVSDIDNLFTKEEEINIYRIVQESLNNLVKHAHASHASLRMQWQDHTLYLRIEDDGIGMHQHNTHKPIHSGFGMIGMEERLKILGGTMTIHTAQEKPGTVLDIKIPTVYEKY